MKHSENKIQADCFKWLRNTYRKTYGLCFHIPNGGLRGGREAKTLQALGVVPGIPDLFLAIPSGKYAGLFIEMKTEDGRESPEQKEIHPLLRAAGYRVETIRNLLQFQTLTKEYLANPRSGRIIYCDSE